MAQGTLGQKTRSGVPSLPIQRIANKKGWKTYMCAFVVRVREASGSRKEAPPRDSRTRGLNP